MVEEEPSATIPDWNREKKLRGEWSPAKALLASIRAYQRARKGSLFARAAALRHRFWSIVTGADIPLETLELGGGFQMPHPNGIVIHPGAKIGPNCLLFQQVTIGYAGQGVPTIGGHVDIGAGAKVLGKIVVGDHAKIGANAVVLTDVPPRATAVGNPARIIRPTS